MSIEMLGKIKNTIKGQSIFTETSLLTANDYFNTLKAEDLDPVRVAIVGDRDIRNARLVCYLITEILKYFEVKDNVIINTGTIPGVERMVSNFANANGIRSAVIEMPPESEWDKCTDNKKLVRDSMIVDSSHVVIIISMQGSKYCNNIHNLARDKGRLVARRNIPKSKRVH